MGPYRNKTWPLLPLLLAGTGALAPTSVLFPTQTHYSCTRTSTTRTRIQTCHMASESSSSAELSRTRNRRRSKAPTVQFVNPNNATNPARRVAPFPASTYTLAAEEGAHKFNWISFIDYPPLQAYSQITRLVEPRNYARKRQFDKANRHVLPSIDDVALPQNQYSTLANVLAWNGIPARAVVGGVSFVAFPYITCFLEDHLLDGVNGDDLIRLVEVFLPGISIVLGTLISLTLSILYDRIGRMQQTVSMETAALSLVCQHLLDLFHDNESAAIEASQCVADQVRTLVRESRGREIMGIIYSDPYARILGLLTKHEADESSPELVAEIRALVAELCSLRAKRMSDEALALPGTHFDVLTFLSALLLLGFSLGTVATVQTLGTPALIAQILFSLFVVVYVLFYEFAFDLNRPFYGVYQLRRSSAAMHLLQIKHLLSHHPVVGDEVDFEQVLDDEDTAVLTSSDGADEKRRKSQTWYY